jgi:hypothetical protein
MPVATGCDAPANADPFVNMTMAKMIAASATILLMVSLSSRYLYSIPIHDGQLKSNQCARLRRAAIHGEACIGVE